MGFISIFKKSVEKSNNDMQGNGGVLLTVSDTTSVSWDEDVHVKPFKLLELSDSTGFTSLEFTPSEGTRKDTAVEVKDLFPTSTAIPRLIGSVLRIPNLAADGYEVVAGKFTKIHLTSGEIFVYGES